MNKIVLIGRTNMGKSSIFNALIGKSISITDMKTNLTKDVVKFESNNFTLFDSPGIMDMKELESIFYKTGEIDIYCIVNDGYITELEKKIIKSLKDKKKILIFNCKEKLGFINEISKIDSIQISTQSGEGIEKLRKILGIDNLSPIKRKTWSIFGRANVGKSTLANKLVGFNRFIVADEVGTTLEVHSEFSDKLLSNIEDTPGYRKNNSLSKLDKASQYRLEQKMQSKDLGLALVVLDSKQGITKSDKYMIDEILDSFLVIVVLSKVDLISKEELQYISNEINRIYPNIQILPVSTIKNDGIIKLTQKMLSSEKILFNEIKTSALNKLLHEEICYSPVKYIIRSGIRDFILFSKKDIPIQKLRFIEKSIIAKFNLFGIRINFIIRKI